MHWLGGMVGSAAGTEQLTLLVAVVVVGHCDVMAPVLDTVHAAAEGDVQNLSGELKARTQ
jgi:hypothetical protein